MTSPLRIPRSPALLVIPVALTLVVLGYWIFDISDSLWLKYHIDTDVYREGAKAFVAGKPIYDLGYEVFGISLPFTYPPLAAVAFTPLTLVPVSVAGLILSLGTLASVWWVARLALEHLGVDRPAVMAVWALPVLSLLEPVRETVAFGQVNAILMAMVATDALYRSKDRLSTGVLAGIAASLKLTPAVFIVYFLVRRQYRAAAVMAGTAVASTLFAAALAPALSWQYFTDTLINTSRIGDPAYLTNQSIFGAVARISSPEVADQIWPVAVLFLLALAVAAAWRVRSNPLATLMVVSLIALLASPVSWSHHWVWIIVAVAACAQGSRWLAVAVLALGIVSPHWLVGEQPWTGWAQAAGNLYVFAGVALLVLACAVPRIFGARSALSRP